MTFEEILDQALAMLQRRGRVTYRLLQRQFQLDDDTLADLLAELRYAHREAICEDEQGMVWTGGAAVLLTPSPPALQPFQPSTSQEAPALQAAVTPTIPQSSDAERRQLTVLFCDLVDSTVLSSQLDPEDLRAVVRAYQEACAKVIARYEGHIAQYLGDGLLVYFGYPLAHEDDAQRAVRVGLGIVEALDQLNIRLTQERGVHLAVRLGIHTGLVVGGEVGGGTRQEQLALGETPNLAARLQGLAAPNTVVISAATVQLLGGFFTCQPLGTPLLKGLAQPLAVYRVIYESMARSRLEAAGSTGWTPLVGREQEIGLLRERWAQVKEGVGQVVLLSGEAGIGKSRLVQVLQEQVAAEPQAWLTPCQCSPYYQHTALYPLIDLLERVALRFDREESPLQKVRKLEGFLVQYGLPLAEAVPLFAALLSLPLTADYAPLTGSPQQQKQQTLQALLTILLRLAAQQPMLFVMEDLHWVDPTTLEFLGLLVDRGPTARILALWTFRPDFPLPWTGRSHLTQVTLPRLLRRQATEMTNRVAHGKALPPEVVEQVVVKTDGVPLFVEELTKMVLESGLLQEREGCYELTGPLPPLAIPATLHDSLMARLDRLATVKGLAQLGATLGREFSYGLLHAVASWDEATLQRGLQQLVEAELLYQQGLPPQATYLFKHALIQDAAYQSLLRSTRQQHHQRIAQVLEGRFPELCETQPELLAHHYTEAGLPERAVGYWQRAGQRALGRSAYMEAMSHITKGIEVLRTLPDTPERAQQELPLQLLLLMPLKALKGLAAPDAEPIHTRLGELCQRRGEASAESFPVVMELWGFYANRGEVLRSRTYAEQALTLARCADASPSSLPKAHWALGCVLVWCGEMPAAHTHLAQALSYSPERYEEASLPSSPSDPTMACLTHAALALWWSGHMDQALERMRQARARAQDLSAPFSLAFAHFGSALLHLFRREPQAVHEHTERLLALTTEHGFVHWGTFGMFLRGWVLAAQGQREAGMTQMRQAIAANRATRVELIWPYLWALAAQVYMQSGRQEAGWSAQADALALTDSHGERFWEAELHRLQGELVQHATRGTWHAALTPEECFGQALAVACRQQAKAWELRAAVSLTRLWQQQGKHAEAYELLAPVYGWFTEGFDTADLLEAKALLEALA